jgi:hypothetical protein
VFLLHDVNQYLDLSGGNLIQQQDEPVAGCSHWPDNHRKSKLRQSQESSSDEDNVNVILDLNAPREAPEPTENFASPPQFEIERAGEVGPSEGSTSGTPETREEVAVESDSHQCPATEEALGNAFEETDSIQFEATPEVGFYCFLNLNPGKLVFLGVLNRRHTLKILYNLIYLGYIYPLVNKFNGSFRNQKEHQRPEFSLRNLLRKLSVHYQSTKSHLIVHHWSWKLLKRRSGVMRWNVLIVRVLN